MILQIGIIYKKQFSLLYRIDFLAQLLVLGDDRGDRVGDRRKHDLFAFDDAWSGTRMTTSQHKAKSREKESNIRSNVRQQPHDQKHKILTALLTHSRIPQRRRLVGNACEATM